MFKVRPINAFLYILSKYFVYFGVLAFIGNRFEDAVIHNAETSVELFKLTLGYIFIWMGIGSLFPALIFYCPFYYIFQIKGKFYFALVLIGFYIIDFYFYYYMYASSALLISVCNCTIGIILLFPFFFKAIKAKFI